MVHRTDIAGGSTGQASPGNGRMRRPALNRPSSKNIPSPELLPASHCGGEKCCRLTIAVPPIPAIYRELLTL
jgi:hypothetical protein